MWHTGTQKRVQNNIHSTLNRDTTSQSSSGPSDYQTWTNAVDEIWIAHTFRNVVYKIKSINSSLLLRRKSLVVFVYHDEGLGMISIMCIFIFVLLICMEEAVRGLREDGGGWGWGGGNWARRKWMNQIKRGLGWALKLVCNGALYVWRLNASWVYALKQNRWRWFHTVCSYCACFMKCKLYLKCLSVRKSAVLFEWRSGGVFFFFFFLRMHFNNPK